LLPPHTPLVTFCLTSQQVCGPIRIQLPPPTAGDISFFLDNLRLPGHPSVSDRHVGYQTSYNRVQIRLPCIRPIPAYWTPESSGSYPSSFLLSFRSGASPTSVPEPIPILGDHPLREKSLKRMAHKGHSNTSTNQCICREYGFQGGSGHAAPTEGFNLILFVRLSTSDTYHTRGKSPYHSRHPQ